MPLTPCGDFSSSSRPQNTIGGEHGQLWAQTSGVHSLSTYTIAQGPHLKVLSTCPRDPGHLSRVQGERLGALEVAWRATPPLWSRCPRLEQSCVDLLQTTLHLPACPEQLQLLCAAILREGSPWDSLSLSCDHIQNTRQLSLVASVLLAQVRQLSPLLLATPPLVALGP